MSIGRKDRDYFLFFILSKKKGAQFKRIDTTKKNNSYVYSSTDAHARAKTNTYTESLCTLFDRLFWRYFLRTRYSQSHTENTHTHTTHRRDWMKWTLPSSLPSFPTRSGDWKAKTNKRAAVCVEGVGWGGEGVVGGGGDRQTDRDRERQRQREEPTREQVKAITTTSRLSLSSTCD